MTIINKAIMHILDNKGDNNNGIPNLELSDFLLDNNDISNEIITEHIENSINDEKRRYAKFRGNSNTIENYCVTLSSDKDNVTNFIDISKEIAERLYTIMSDKRISPAYLLVCEFEYKDLNYIGILKLDFSPNYKSTKEVLENGLIKLGIKHDNNGIPNGKQKLQKSVFYNPELGLKEDNSSEVEFNLILLDRQDKGDDSASFFKNDFLDCTLAITEKENTSGFYEHTKNLIKSTYKNDVNKQIEYIDYIEKKLRIEDNISISEIANHIFENDNELINNYIETINKYKVDLEFKVYDNLNVIIPPGKRTLNTDLGISINFPSDMNIVDNEYVHKASDGKYNIIIKNVDISIN